MSDQARQIPQCYFCREPEGGLIMTAPGTFACDRCAALEYWMRGSTPEAIAQIARFKSPEFAYAVAGAIHVLGFEAIAQAIRDVHTALHDMHERTNNETSSTS
jgi:hypothetical protein